MIELISDPTANTSCQQSIKRKVKTKEIGSEDDGNTKYQNSERGSVAMKKGIEW